MKNIKLISLLSLLLFTAGCATGSVHIRTAKSDGSTVIASTNPVPLKPKNISLMFTQYSSHPDGVVKLFALVKGTQKIASGKSLHFNIDGKKVSFRPLTGKEHYVRGVGIPIILPGVVTILPGRKSTSVQYKVNRKFLKRLFEGSEVTAKVNLKGSTVEGTLSDHVRKTLKEYYEGTAPGSRYYTMAQKEREERASKK